MRVCVCVGGGDGSGGGGGGGGGGGVCVGGGGGEECVCPYSAVHVGLDGCRQGNNKPQTGMRV